MTPNIVFHIQTNAQATVHVMKMHTHTYAKPE